MGRPMSARNSFPEDHRLFAGFLPADRAAIVARLNGSDFILVLGAPVFTYHVEGAGPHVPTGAALVQLTDDPAAAAWCPVGTSIVTNLKLGVAALLSQSKVAGIVAARIVRRQYGAASVTHRGNRPRRQDSAQRHIGDAEHCRAATCPQHRRGRSPQQPRGDARLSAIRGTRHVLHLRQRRPGPRPACRCRRRARASRSQGHCTARRRLGDVCHTGIVERRGPRHRSGLHHYQQPELQSPGRSSPITLGSRCRPPRHWEVWISAPWPQVSASRRSG